MILNDYKNKAVIITGGTKGLGLATGLAFGKVGAHVYLTCKWRTANEDDIRKQFAALHAPEPALVEADAAYQEDTRDLLERVGENHDSVEVLVSNVSFSQVVNGVETYKKRHFLKSLEYSAWPFVGYLQEIKKAFGRYPRYVIGSSCDGPDTYYPGYDFVAAAKTTIEVFCKYMAAHLLEEDVRINILRSRPVSTESLVATFGEEFEPFLKSYYSNDYFIAAEAVGNAILALCSGLMDAVSGQVILLDKGVAFCDNLMRLFEHRTEYGLELPTL